MSSYYRQLKMELRQAGAKSSEIDQLTSLASKLSRLKTATSAERGWFRLLKPAALASLTLAVGVFVVMLSQSAAPTSRLYAIQKLSDDVAVKAHPQYQAVVMMRRAQQVNDLVASRANSGVILATLNNYQAEAADYKTMPHTNYAAFEYCKTNLQQAAAAATPVVHQAIQSSLDSLSST